MTAFCISGNNNNNNNNACSFDHSEKRAWWESQARHTVGCCTHCCAVWWGGRPGLSRAVRGGLLVYLFSSRVRSAVVFSCVNNLR